MVACAANGRYALPLEIMLASLRSQLPPDCPVEAYCLTSDFPRFSGLDWRDGCISTGGLSPVDGPPSRFPPIVLAPIWLAELLPARVKKVLFLDADLLVLDSILPLGTLGLRRTAGSVGLKKGGP